MAPHDVFAADEWQQHVLRLLSSAQLVIWQAGTSAGTWWELEQIVANVNPERVVIIVPSPVRRADFYRYIFDAASRVLPRGLPDTFEEINYVLFDARWSPVGHPYVNQDPLGTFFSSSPLDVHATFALVRDALVRAAPGGQNHIGRPAWPERFGRLRPTTGFRTRGHLADRNSWSVLRNVCFHSSQPGTLPYGSRVRAAVRTIDARGVPSVATASRAVLESDASRSYASRASHDALLHFQERTRNWAQAALPKWREQVTTGDVTIDSVTEAFRATGDETLVRAWNRRG